LYNFTIKNRRYVFMLPLATIDDHNYFTYLDFL
jgi:hypothetical protein